MVSVQPLSRFDQSLFKNLTKTIRTLRWRFQNVIRHARIGSGNAIQDAIERNLGASSLQCSHDSMNSSASRNVIAFTKTTFCSSGVGSKKSKNSGTNLMAAGAEELALFFCALSPHLMITPT